MTQSVELYDHTLTRMAQRNLSADIEYVIQFGCPVRSGDALHYFLRHEDIPQADRKFRAAPGRDDSSHGSGRAVHHYCLSQSSRAEGDSPEGEVGDRATQTPLNPTAFLLPLKPVPYHL